MKIIYMDVTLKVLPKVELNSLLKRSYNGFKRLGETQYFIKEEK